MLLHTAGWLDFDLWWLDLHLWRSLPAQKILWFSGPMCKVFRPYCEIKHFNQTQILSGMGIILPEVQTPTSSLTQHELIHTTLGKNFLLNLLYKSLKCLHYFPSKSLLLWKKDEAQSYVRLSPNNREELPKYSSFKLILWSNGPFMHFLWKWIL